MNILMFSYTIIHTPSFGIDNKVIDKILKEISNIEEKEQSGTLNIVFLDEDSIKELNNKYRSIDKVTDVLSFHYYDNFTDLEKDEIAWEVILCENILIKQANEYKLSNSEEFYKLFIHSCLHILWYDHEIENDYRQMNEKENKIWQEVFEK